jgi:hypothetical protein
VLGLGILLKEFRTAEAAELALGRIDLSAILARVHIYSDGSVHAVI